MVIEPEGFSTRCCKCKSSEVGITWHPEHKAWRSSTGMFFDYAPERFSCKCSRCGYEWTEPITDQEAA